MLEPSSTPNILVTIGGQTRLYFAFVTTATSDCDLAGTVTLHAAALSDVSGLAADPITVDAHRAQHPARLVLIDAMELRSQQAKYLGKQHLVLPAHPALVGLNTLQQWLWHRIQAPAPDQMPVNPLVEYVKQQ